MTSDLAVIFTLNLQQINFAFFTLFANDYLYEQQYAPASHRYQGAWLVALAADCMASFIYLARLDRPLAGGYSCFQVGGLLALARHHLA